MKNLVEKFCSIYLLNMVNKVVIIKFSSTNWHRLLDGRTFKHRCSDICYLGESCTCDRLEGDAS